MLGVWMVLAVNLILAVLCTLNAVHLIETGWKLRRLRIKVNFVEVFLDSVVVVSTLILWVLPFIFLPLLLR